MQFCVKHGQWGEILPWRSHGKGYVLRGVSRVYGKVIYQHVLFVWSWPTPQFLLYNERNSNIWNCRSYIRLTYKFLFPVLPNLPWHCFYRNQIFGARKQIQSKFQGGAHTTQFPQGRLALSITVFRCELFPYRTRTKAGNVVKRIKLGIRSLITWPYASHRFLCVSDSTSIKLGLMLTLHGVSVRSK